MTDLEQRKELGNFGENIAGRYLQAHGYTILQRNYRKPWGEIDIIVQKGDAVVFVEVKTNGKVFKGDFKPELRVNPIKLKKISKTALLYLQYEFKTMDVEWQIDTIAVVIDKINAKAKIQHFKNVASALF